MGFYFYKSADWKPENKRRKELKEIHHMPGKPTLITEARSRKVSHMIFRGLNLASGSDLLGNVISVLFAVSSETNSCV